MIKGPKDNQVNYVKWGPLDESIYYCTDKGRLLKYNLEEQGVELARDVNRNEIFTITFSHDYTMLFTTSRDGTCKLIHPESFEEIRSFAFNFPCRNAAISPLFDAKEN